MEITISYKFNKKFDDFKSKMMLEFSEIINIVESDSNIIIITTAIDSSVETSIIEFASDLTQKDHVMSVVSAAIDFGRYIMEDYAANNILLGITQQGKTKAVADYLAGIMRYIQSGSLYEVIAEIDRLIADNIPPELSPYVTEETLTEFKTKISDYLEIT